MDGAFRAGTHMHRGIHRPQARGTARARANVDFDGGTIQVRKQLDRNGKRVEPKTPQAVRSVVLMPALARVLKEHRLRSLFSADGDLVVPLDCRHRTRPHGPAACSRTGDESRRA